MVGVVVKAHHIAQLIDNRDLTVIAVVGGGDHPRRVLQALVNSDLVSVRIVIELCRGLQWITRRTNSLKLQIALIIDSGQRIMRLVPVHGFPEAGQNAIAISIVGSRNRRWS